MDWVGFEPPIWASYDTPCSLATINPPYIDWQAGDIDSPHTERITFVAPFQTSCALLASLFKKMAQVADSNCYTSLLGAAFTIHHGSTCAIQKRMWHLSIRLRPAGSCHFPFSFKRMTRATDSNCYPYLSAAAFTIHQRFYPCHPQSSWSKIGGCLPHISLNQLGRLEPHWNRKTLTNTKKAGLKYFG